MNKNILVLFGGKSVEHDISVITAMQAINNLNKQKYTTYPVFVDKQGRWFFSEKFSNIKGLLNFNPKDKNIKPALLMPMDNNLYLIYKNKLKKLATIDCVLFATHGGLGENGAIQGLVEVADLPYTCTNVLSSAICMNKLICKKLFENAGLNVCEYVSITTQDLLINQKQTINNVIDRLNFPMVVKPCSLGSSIGISYVTNKKQLTSALALAGEFDDSILVERAVDNLQEVNISVFRLDGKVITSELEKPITTKNLLDFNEKYLNGSNTKSGMANLSRELPAKLPPAIREQIIDMASKAYALCQCKGVVRIDFLLDSASNRVYINEINTIPGSLSFYLWQKSGYDFDKLLDLMIEQAIVDKVVSKKKSVVYTTNVLDNFATNSDGLKMHK